MSGEKNYMKIKIERVFFVAVFTLAASLTVYSQDKSILNLADEYSLALKNYQAQKARSSVESVIQKGKAVAANLVEMENLSDADYSSLEKKMKGFVINRTEIVFVEPDLKFFATLSKTHGTKADIAYFTLMRQIIPDNVWAAYIKPQTDYSGCTIYGNGVLTSLYGKALQFKKTYPTSYTEDIDEEITDILSALTQSTCACGSRASVEKEFRLFIQTFPKDKNTPSIKERLANLRKNKDFRFKCVSG